jgi:polyisoprenoid-binding protein YceI
MTVTATLTGLSAGTWTIDPTHTEVGFVARHLMVSKVRGAFTDVSGTVAVGDELSASRAEVVIRTASVATGTPDRDAHLRSGDFLDVDAYPEMTFVSTSFDGETLVGDLTIKGVTKSVSVDLEYAGSAVDPFDNTRVGFEGATVINRKDWGVEWNAPLETGGVLVGDKVTLEFDISAIRSAD